MKYDRLIIEILMEAGSDGLTVRKVSRHVFNAVNGLFDEADIEAVHKLVRAFLLRHSKGVSPALDRPKHGSYALNRRTGTDRAPAERRNGSAQAAGQRPGTLDTLRRRLFRR